MHCFALASVVLMRRFLCSYCVLADEYGHRGRSPPRPLVPDYVTRVLVSAPQLARIIGRGGAQINTIRQNCGIRMETIDLPGDERMVCVWLAFDGFEVFECVWSI